MKSKIEFEHGALTCAVEPGKFCRFVGTLNWGTKSTCMLFNEHLWDKDGWLQRCGHCREDAVEVKE